MHSIFHALHVWHFHPAHVNRRSRRRLAKPSALLPPSSTLGILSLVRSEVERDEEQEVGGEDAHAGEGSKFFTRALAGGRKLREVG